MQRLKIGILVALTLVFSATLLNLVEQVESDEAAVQATTRPAATDSATVAFKPVQPVGVMMEGQQKLYGDLKLAVADKSWVEAQTLTWLLAEVANVNQYHNEDSQYRAFAKTMSDQCVELIKPLRARDAETAKTGIKQISQTCKACHKQFKED